MSHNVKTIIPTDDKMMALAILSMAAMLIAVGIYCLTFSIAAFSAIFVLMSIVTFSVLAPYIVEECKTMIRGKTEETRSVETAIQILTSSVLIMTFIIFQRGRSYMMITPSAWAISSVIDFITLIILPIALLLCSLMEHAVCANWISSASPVTEEEFWYVIRIQLIKICHATKQKKILE